MKLMLGSYAHIPFHPRVLLDFAAIVLFCSNIRADNISRKTFVTVVFLALIDQPVSNPHRWHTSNV